VEILIGMRLMHDVVELQRGWGGGEVWIISVEVAHIAAAPILSYENQPCECDVIGKVVRREVRGVAVLDQVLARIADDTHAVPEAGFYRS
jgi:hypothetical protein